MGKTLRLAVAIALAAGATLLPASASASTCIKIRAGAVVKVDCPTVTVRPSPITVTVKPPRKTITITPPKKTVTRYRHAAPKTSYKTITKPVVKNRYVLRKETVTQSHTQYIYKTSPPIIREKKVFVPMPVRTETLTQTETATKTKTVKKSRATITKHLPSKERVVYREHTVVLTKKEAFGLSAGLVTGGALIALLVCYLFYILGFKASDARERSNLRKLFRDTR